MGREPINTTQSPLARLHSEETKSSRRICNDNLRCTVVLAPWWTALLNNFLYIDIFPPQRRNATLLVICKEKSNLKAPSSWRRIANKSVCDELFSGLQSKRPKSYLCHCNRVGWIPLRTLHRNNVQDPDGRRQDSIGHDRQSSVCDVCRFRSSLLLGAQRRDHVPAG